MTDKEIFETEIKCINRRANGKCNGGTDCCKCDLLMNEKDIISAYERAIANSNLINRKQVEIEGLQKANEELGKVIAGAYQLNCFLEVSRKCVRKEAIEEFAERLKEKKQEVFTAVNDSSYAVTVYDIDNLAKEMEGED